MLETATGLPEKIIPNDAKIQFACRNFLFELNASFFLFFFTAITLIINAMALYGNVFVASLIYRPPSLVPILTAL